LNRLIKLVLALTCFYMMSACVSTTPHRDRVYGQATALAKQQMLLNPDYGADAGDTLPMVREMEQGVRAYQNNTLLNNSGKPSNPAFKESITSGN
jgi:hypothetical protein